VQFAKKQIVPRTNVQKQVPLFSHLPQYERETSLSLKVNKKNVG
jgi:translation initiation factor eIF-2B subunit delta